jgi:hypothetical protein
VVIAADRGQDGEASAEIRRARYTGLGLACGVVLPPAPFGDWNDWGCRQAAAAPV